MERYREFVRRNAGLLSLLESGLSSATWLLPERFEGGELAIEAVHTALGLISSFHDSIVSAPPGAPAAPSNDLALALSMLQQVQVLIELVATRREEQRGGSRYTSLAVLETIKSLVRMVAWRQSGSRLLLQGGCASSDARAVQPAGSSATAAKGRPQEVYGAFAAFRERRCGPQPQQQQRQADAAGGKGAGVRGELSGTAAAARGEHGALPQRLLAAAELLHIWRPVAYALALRRWGRRSWRPWLLSLAIDVLSLQLHSAAARALQASSWFGSVQPANLGPSLALLQCLQRSRWSGEEERELSARRLRLAVYLLRDPLFARYTQVALEGWVRGTARVPLVGWLSGRAAEILEGVQRYYTYVERMASA